MTTSATRAAEQLFIGGAWAPPTDGRIVDVVNPATEEPIGRAALAGPQDIDRAARAARGALGAWSAWPVHERAALLRRAGALLERRADELAALVTLEAGSPRRVATAQTAACRLFLDWHAAQADTFPWEEHREGVGGPLLVRRRPVGVVAAIVPWNYPLGLSFPKLSPALLTGCTVVLKPPEETPLFGAVLAAVFAEAGLPPGVLNVVAADRRASETLVTHPLVDKVSFTGSTAAGRRIAALCGERLKRCSLELGGKSAAILLPDADLDAVVPALAPSTMANNGQTCHNQTRVLAPRARHDEVVEALREAIGAWRIGDPTDPDVEVGPLISEAQRARVEAYIETGRAEGARLVLGGDRAGRDRGYFVAPTLFAGVDNAMTIAREEIFGPVVAVIPYDSVDDAVAIANDSDYGLSGSVWGPDPDRAMDVARRIESGNVAVNQHRLDLAAPFGGLKSSGLGREYGLEGIDEYVELQTIPH
jgi:betaine-aldehyde dehydrogenase